MKQVLIIFSLLASMAFAGCGRTGGANADASLQPVDTGKAVIKFSEIEHNFGMVNEGEKVGCIFVFRNTGTAALQISSATTSCGCTVPKYDKKPIPPGSEGTLEVIFDTSGRNGIQTKTITVASNAISPVLMLSIKAEIITNH